MHTLVLVLSHLLIHSVIMLAADKFIILYTVQNQSRGIYTHTQFPLAAPAAVPVTIIHFFGSLSIYVLNRCCCCCCWPYHDTSPRRRRDQPASSSRQKRNIPPIEDIVILCVDLWNSRALLGRIHLPQSRLFSQLIHEHSHCIPTPPSSSPSCDTSRRRRVSGTGSLSPLPWN